MTAIDAGDLHNLRVMLDNFLSHNQGFFDSIEPDELLTRILKEDSEALHQYIDIFQDFGQKIRVRQTRQGNSYLCPMCIQQKKDKFILKFGICTDCSFLVAQVLLTEVQTLDHVRTEPVEFFRSLDVAEVMYGSQSTQEKQKWINDAISKQPDFLQTFIRQLLLPVIHQLKLQKCIICKSHRSDLALPTCLYCIYAMVKTCNLKEWTYDQLYEYATKQPGLFIAEMSTMKFMEQSETMPPLIERIKSTCNFLKTQPDEFRCLFDFFKKFIAFIKTYQPS